jgi:hypothetical protein
MTQFWCPECEEYRDNYHDDDLEQPLRCLECGAALIDGHLNDNAQT